MATPSIISHGRFCEELKASTEMIMGPQDNIHAAVPSCQRKVLRSLQPFEACVADFEDYIAPCGSLGTPVIRLAV